MKANPFLIPCVIIIALVLQIMPMPAQADLYRPDWVLLVLCYWSMALPNRVNVGVAAICGVVLDILYGTALGVHSLALAVPVYLIAANYQRLRNYSIPQQIMMVLVLGTLYHILIFWLQYWLIGVQFRFDFLLPVVSSVFLWPWLFWLLRKLRRRMGVN